MSKTFYTTLFVIILGFSASFAYLDASHNWDMLGYVASAISYGGGGPKAIHDKTYGYIKGDRYLIRSNHYKGVMADNYAFFYQQLPFYTIRPLYVGPIYILYRLGLNPIDATVLISVVAYAAVCLLFFAWTIRNLGNLLGFGLSILMATNHSLRGVAKISTPDALSAFVALLAVYFLVEKKNTSAFAALITLSLFARTDNIILLLMLAAYLAFLAPADYRLDTLRAGLLVSVSIACYVLINALAGNYGWTTLFYHTFIEHIPNPAEFKPHVTFSDYTHTLTQNIIPFLTKGAALIYSLVLVSFYVLNRALSAFRIKSSTDRVYLHLAVIMAANVVVRFLLFPMPATRLNIAQLVFAVVAFAVLILRKAAVGLAFPQGPLHLR